MASGSSAVRVHDAVAGGLNQTLRNQNADIKAIEFSPNYDLLVEGSREDTMIYNTSTWENLMTLDHNGEDVNSISFSGDGSLVATGDGVNIWNVSTGIRQYQFNNHTDNVGGLSFCEIDSNLLASGLNDFTL